jgi:2-oxoisovalerate dehydrogenase E1 component
MAYYEIRDWIRELKPGKEQKGVLTEYGDLDKKTLEKLYRLMVLARRIELEEKILLRKGLCRFFIGCGGKELVDVVAAHFLDDSDPFIGYYRNKAFDMSRGVSIKQKMYEAVGDRRSTSTGGMLQVSHSSYPELGILPQASPTGSHALEAAGLGEAIKCPVPIDGRLGIKGGRFAHDALTYCAIGEGSTSSPEFHRAVFYSVYNKSRNIFGIYNCGWAISTSVSEQFHEGNPTTPFEGYKRFGLMIENFDGTEIKETIKTFKKMIDYVRSGKGPVICNINVTREDSHSGSDDQTHYMEPELQRYHIESDPLRKAARQLIDDGLFKPEELASFYDEYDKEVGQISAEVTADIHYKKPEDVLTKVYSYNKDSAFDRWYKLIKEKGEIRRERYREFHKKGYFPTEELPENQQPMTMRAAINYTLFDMYMMTDDIILFGEDVADFAQEVYEKGEEVMNKLKGKGGVFLATKNLQRAFGPDRIHNTPLDEAGILGRAVGHSYQGRVPSPEIQFIDYISPGYQQLKDRIATTYQRSAGHVQMPMVIRTSYGGYKQGAGAMWHSEANLGAFINIPGLHVAVPSNAADTAGLMRTAFVCGDPVLFCEPVALYNRRDWDGYNILAKYPPIEELIPFGEAKVYNEEADDIGIISYGITLPICLRVGEQLREKNISARVLDLRTVKPIDWNTISETVKQCSKILIVSEDRYHGGVGPTIAGYISDHGFDYLDAPVRIITAKDARVAYGADGDEICIPQQKDILQAAIDLAEY